MWRFVVALVFILGGTVRDTEDILEKSERSTGKKAHTWTRTAFTQFKVQGTDPDLENGLYTGSTYDAIFHKYESPRAVIYFDTKHNEHWDDELPELGVSSEEHRGDADVRARLKQLSSPERRYAGLDGHWYLNKVGADLTMAIESSRVEPNAQIFEPASLTWSREGMTVSEATEEDKQRFREGVDNTKYTISGAGEADGQYMGKSEAKYFVRSATEGKPEAFLWYDGALKVRKDLENEREDDGTNFNTWGAAWYVTSQNNLAMKSQVMDADSTAGPEDVSLSWYSNKNADGSNEEDLTIYFDESGKPLEGRDATAVVFTKTAI